MAIKPCHVHFFHVPIRKGPRERARADVGGNIVVQALAAHADEHRRRHALDPMPPQDAGHATERKLVADFHEIGLFLLEYFSQSRRVRQGVKVREQQTVARIEYGTLRRGDRIDSPKRADFFHGILRAGNDKPDFPLVPVRRFEKGAGRRYGCLPKKDGSDS